MKNPEDQKGYLFSKGYSNYVFMLLFLLYMFDYIDRSIVTSMFTSIEGDWGISHTQSGMLVSAVYWAIVHSYISLFHFLLTAGAGQKQSE